MPSARRGRHTFASYDVLNEVFLERILAGLATRRHAAGRTGRWCRRLEAVATPTSKSAVSRRFAQFAVEGAGRQATMRALCPVRFEA